MKIIFLDIDGVLAVPNPLKKGGVWGLSEEKQHLLGKILTQTDAKIVLSSSWRLHTLEKTREYMTSEGFMFSDKIIGITIRAYHYLQKGTGIHLSIPRGVEIKQWLDTNIHSNQGKDWSRKELNKDFTYVIIDDDGDMLLEQKDQFILTDSYAGLQDVHVDQAVKILNKI